MYKPNVRPATAVPLASLAIIALVGFLVASCTTPKPGKISQRKGDEIVVAGQFIHTGTAVVLWMDPGGFDAYRVERRFSSMDHADWASSQMDVRDLHSPNRFDMRTGLTAAQAELVRGGGWDLATLQSVVDQFVIHYDAAGTSRTCFKILHDARGLSVHFMLDLDGTIYQTLDLKERAWHATTSNSRSIGIEIANRGAFGPNEKEVFKDWYRKDASGTFITIPASAGTNTQRTVGFIGRPARPDLVVGMIQGQTLRQYDLTPQQYQALIRLTAALCKTFPNLKCDYPRDASGHLITCKLPDKTLAGYHGLLGHFHIQTNKVDPGPAFQWDLVVNGARQLMR
jgi:N-acetyl-anhydromuramyl-L-alanine amidase AmpD